MTRKRFFVSYPAPTARSGTGPLVRETVRTKADRTETERVRWSAPASRRRGAVLGAVAGLWLLAWLVCLLWSLLGLLSHG